MVCFDIDFGTHKLPHVRGIIFKKLTPYYDKVPTDVVDDLAYYLHKREDKYRIKQYLQKELPSHADEIYKWMDSVLVQKLGGRSRKEYNSRDSHRRTNRDNSYKNKDIRFTVTVGNKDSKRNSSSKRDNHKNEQAIESKSSDWDLPERLTQKRSRDTLPQSPINEEPDKKRVKKTENCRFFPNCTEGDNCPYNHPTQLCNKFPNCSFGAKCLYYHPKPIPTFPQAQPFYPPVQRGIVPQYGPPCRYGFACLNRLNGCTFSHPLEACRFGNNCARVPRCRYGHSVHCKFGINCTRPGCTFSHAQPSQEVIQQEENIEGISASLPSTPPKNTQEDNNQKKKKKKKKKN